MASRLIDDTPFNLSTSTMSSSSAIAAIMPATMMLVSTGATLSSLRTSALEYLPSLFVMPPAPNQKRAA